ncbi:caspase family protein [Chenggangzhangella methanolivorans]|uniref:Caspase family protein n=1 Tax=Chenggangzhangella methanolivorans TaxID=1437009 RepID=A0A9E6RCW5_9HYPH|nr:caspase family protein [Chenggangzhangella methanolivorans]QZN98715.1 caspase family protein [Chenggangzhangella methanolivorans]
MVRLLAVLALLFAAVPLAFAEAPRAFDDNADSIAIVVGNRNYKQTTPVDYAHNDAGAIREFLVRGLRFRDENVFVLQDATLNELNQAFGSEANPQGGRLWRSVVAGRSNVFVYYSGHGAPDLRTRQPFLLPQDGDPNFPESGYALETLYRNLELVKQKVGPARQVVVMVDACFTGETGRKGENMLAVSAPGFTPAKPKAAGGVVRLAATSGATPANWDEGAKLGLFTSRFLMGAAGLAAPKGAGAGDARRVEWADLQAYVAREVQATARREVGREQAPEIDVAALSLPMVEPAPAIRRSFDRARDEAAWRSAEIDGSREALEAYVGQCAEPCAYRDQAMDRLLKRRRAAEATADDETWRRLSAEGKYQAYLDGCGKVCAYRRLALGYLGKDGEAAAPPPLAEPEKPAAPAEARDPAKELQAAKAAGTVEALDAFLKANPKGRLATEARAARAALVKRTPSSAPAAAATRTKPYEPTAAELRAFKATEAEMARYRPTAAQQRALGERYRPEYNRRAARDGRAAADAWLKSVAFEVGRRQGEQAKRQILIDRRRAAEAAGR